jgi:predicted DNA-binding protein with PD1-like motif
MFPLLMLGSMGQISLLNTYAHIHTPLMISLMRSGHGMWSGILIGIIFIVILELILHKLQTADAKRKAARLAESKM